MERTPILSAAALAAALALNASAASAEEASADSAPEYSVKVSLSREDPDLHRREVGEEAPYVEFFLFLDGNPARGTEFGISIEGGELVAYAIATDLRWVAFPLADPYPGTVAQVTAGSDCHGPPLYLGRMLVRPAEPGGRIALDVIPSVHSEAAVAVRCDLTPANGLEAYPAVVNGEPLAPHFVTGKDLEAPADRRPAPRPAGGSGAESTAAGGAEPR